MKNKNQLFWEHFNKNKYAFAPCEDLFRHISKHHGFNSKIKKNSLELGFGSGVNINALLQLGGWNTFGIDISNAGLINAKKRIAGNRMLTRLGKQNLKLGSFEDLMFKDNYFDLIYDIESLYCNEVNLIQNAIDESYRCLKQDGTYFGKMFGIKTTGSTSGKEISKNTFENLKKGIFAGHKVAHFVTKAEIRKLFKKYKNIEINYQIHTRNNSKVQIYQWIIEAKK